MNSDRGDGRGIIFGRDGVRVEERPGIAACFAHKEARRCAEIDALGICRVDDDVVREVSVRSVVSVSQVPVDVPPGLASVRCLERTFDVAADVDDVSVLRVNGEKVKVAASAGTDVLPGQVSGMDG